MAGFSACHLTSSFCVQLSLWDRVLYPHHQHRLRPSQLLLGGLRHACKTKFIHKWIIRFNVWQHACMHIYTCMCVCVPRFYRLIAYILTSGHPAVACLYSTKFGTCDTECSNARSDSANDLCCHLVILVLGKLAYTHHSTCMHIYCFCKSHGPHSDSTAMKLI